MPKTKTQGFKLALADRAWLLEVEPTGANGFFITLGRTDNAESIENLHKEATFSADNGGFCMGNATYRDLQQLHYLLHELLYPGKYPGM